MNRYLRRRARICFLLGLKAYCSVCKKYCEVAFQLPSLTDNATAPEPWTMTIVGVVCLPYISYGSFLELGHSLTEEFFVFSNFQRQHKTSFVGVGHSVFLKPCTLETSMPEHTWICFCTDLWINFGWPVSRPRLLGFDYFTEESGWDGPIGNENIAIEFLETFGGYCQFDIDVLSEFAPEFEQVSTWKILALRRGMHLIDDVDVSILDLRLVLLPGGR